MKSVALCALVLLPLAAGCGQQAPLAPKSQVATSATSQAASAASISTTPVSTAPLSATASNAGNGIASPGRPGYEQAYVADQTVTINAIEVPPVAPEQAQADFYEVVYPPNWQALGLNPPQCDPCDHDHNGIDAQDYHDHVLDSMPSSPGHGAYKAPWHVWAVAPAAQGTAAHNDSVFAAYASRLPVRSEDEVNALVAARLPDGSPIAAKLDTHFYFLCAVVSPNAAR
jgi:hypothetical protein